MANGKPTRNNSQILGDIGESTVSLIIKKFGWTADIIKSDYGEDIDCNIFIDNKRTNYHFRCQVKSSKKDSEYIKELATGNYSLSISSDILRVWLTSYFPIFVIIYEADTDTCYWCNPQEQILKNPSKLEKENPTIHVPKRNIFDNTSQKIIYEEVSRFYQKILRLGEFKMECKVIPVLMPNYRVIPYHDLYNLSKSNNISIDISSDNVELVPSWMSILKRIEPSNYLPSVSMTTSDTDLKDFLLNIERALYSFKFTLKKNEWISFIISPVKTTSNNSAWVNELTFWMTYTKKNKNVYNDFEYNYKIPTGFKRQVSRRARSWDFFHHVNSDKDLALQLFGAYPITPTIQNIDKTHTQNIRGQYITWTCKKGEVDTLFNLIDIHELTIQIIDDSSNNIILAITTIMFDPFLGLSVVPKDWDSFEKGSVRHVLKKNKLLSKLPGKEYDGKLPDYLENELNKYSNRSYNKMLLTELEYIPGFPLMLDQRLIQVSRFQIVPQNKMEEIYNILERVSLLKLENYNIEFGIRDNTYWNDPICELSITWSPEIAKSSKQAYEEVEDKILKIFDEILPTNNSAHLKNSYEILHIAGEIGFETD